MPKFSVSFVFYDDHGMEKPGVVPVTEFSTETTSKKEFWEKLRELEKKLSRQYNGDVIHLIVTTPEDIPECDIRAGDTIAYNNLEL